MSISWTPQPYQERALGMMMEQAAVGLFLDPGLGKTSTCLAAFTLLQNAGAVSKMLIIAPLRVCYSVWPQEVEKWDDFNHLRVSILHGPGKEAALDEEADIYLINPEGLKWFLDPSAGRFERVGADVLCVDESSKFKATTSQRFKLIRPRVQSFSRRWILTGTPAPNGLADIFGQVFLLDMGAALGRYITHFRNRWFYQTGYGGYTYSPKEGAYDEVTELIRPLSLRLSAKDNLEMPELRVGGRWDIHVDLPQGVMGLYKQVESDLVAQVSSGDIIAMNTAAAGTKCRQIANGAVYTTDLDDPSSRDWQPLHDEKLLVLSSLVEELGGAPLLVFYEYEHDKERIMNMLNCPCISGTSAAAGRELVQQFNDGTLPVLLAHPASAGHGLNMQEACSHVCWFGLTWNLEYYQQAIDRVYRQGQKHPVTVYRILAKNTLDEVVAERLLEKEVTQDRILDALR